MKKCDVCGNDYKNPFTVTLNNKNYMFDCFECAIHKLAPICNSCGCKVIGHGAEKEDLIYCCEHCAQQE